MSSKDEFEQYFEAANDEREARRAEHQQKMDEVATAVNLLAQKWADTIVSSVDRALHGQTSSFGEPGGPPVPQQIALGVFQLTYARTGKFSLRVFAAIKIHYAYYVQSVQGVPPLVDGKQLMPPTIQRVQYPRTNTTRGAIVPYLVCRLSVAGNNSYQDDFFPYRIDAPAFSAFVDAPKLREVLKVLVGRLPR